MKSLIWRLRYALEMRRRIKPHTASFSFFWESATEYLKCSGSTADHPADAVDIEMSYWD